MSLTKIYNFFYLTNRGRKTIKISNDTFQRVALTHNKRILEFKQYVNNEGYSIFYIIKKVTISF